MNGVNAVRPMGPTLTLSVGNTSHAAVLLTFTGNDIDNWALCLNTGAAAVAVNFTQTGVAATIGSDGNTGNFVLPPSMQYAMLIPIPSITPYVTAIGAAAGPSVVYITPCSAT